MRLFLDSNVILRFLVPENKKMLAECEIIFNKIERGQIIPLISDIVIMEVSFVLTRIYKKDKVRVIEWLKDLLQLPNLILIEKTNIQKAIALYARLNIKLGDCLIATQIPTGIPLCTYDADFSKIKELKVVTPKDVN